MLLLLLVLLIVRSLSNECVLGFTVVRHRPRRRRRRRFVRGARAERTVPAWEAFRAKASRDKVDWQ